MFEIIAGYDVHDVGKQYHASQGESLSVSCQADGDPQPNVWWSKVQDRTLQRIATRGDPDMLTLRGLDSSDAGEYVCQAKNRIGTAEASIHLYVHCKWIPLQVIQMSNFL